MSSKPNIPVDPVLERQLSAAGDDDAVEATFSLRPPSDGNLLMDPAEVRSTVDRIVKIAQDKAGQKVRDLNVLPRIQQFVLAAPPKVVREVLKCREIASALANRQPEDIAIEPVGPPAKKSRPRHGGKPKRGDN
jgi:hypothetical protein